MVRRKIFTCNIKEIAVVEDKLLLYGKQIDQVELMGVCIEQGDKYIRILDFYSEIILFKHPNTEIPSHRCIFRCKLFVKDGVPALYCTNVERVDFYEEIFFIVEANKLNERERHVPNETERHMPNEKGY